MSTTFIPDVIAKLEAAGLGTYGVNIFKGVKAVLPDDVPPGMRTIISVARTGGGGDAGTHNDSRNGIAYETPSAQIVFRAPDYADVEADAEVGYAALNFVDRFINDTWWRFCRPQQEPFELPVDEKGRVRFAFNIGCEKRPSPATS